MDIRDCNNFHTLTPDKIADAVREEIQTYLWFTSGSSDELDEYMWIFGNEAGRKKIKFGECSHCGGKFRADKDSTGNELTFWRAKHGEEAICPCCGYRGKCMARGKMRTYESAREITRLLFPDRVSRDEVILRGFWIEVNYNSSEAQGDISYAEEVRYRLTRGNVEMIRRSFSNYYGWGNWKEIKKIAEPWSMMYNGNPVWYSIACLDDLRDTFLGYLPYAEFADREYPAHSYYAATTNRVPWGKILSYAAKYPAVEMAAKMGLWGIIYDLLVHDKLNSRWISWKAGGLRGFFKKIPLGDSKKIIASEPNDIINLLKFIRLGGVSCDDAIMYAKRFDYDALAKPDIAGEDGPIKVAKYLIRQRYSLSGIAVLRDYREWAVKLGRDLNVPTIRFPKNLTLAHDEYMGAVAALEREKEALAKKQIEESYLKTYQNYRRLYEFVSGEWGAFVPERLEDIVLEGKNQHHCVGGYVDRHAEGKTIIIFIRKEMYPMMPRYTVEISPEGALRQIQGFHNATPTTPDVDAFVKRWLAEVSRRMIEEVKRNKKNTENVEIKENIA